MRARRDFLLGTVSAMAAALFLPPVATANTEAVPNMPRRNAWLTDSVYPTSHFNPGATDSVLIAGPVNGRKLAPADVKTVPTVITSNPTIKKIGNETIAFGSGAVGPVVVTVLALGAIVGAFVRRAARGAPVPVQSEGGARA